MDKSELVIFTICGQEFRIRATGDEADRTRRVADFVQEQIQKNRNRGANSDLRATLMTAYELAYEKMDQSDTLEQTRHQQQEMLQNTREAVEKLLEKMDVSLNE